MDNKNNIQNSIKKALINATLFGISATSVGCSDVSSLNSPNNNESIESTIDSSVKQIRPSNKNNLIDKKDMARAINEVEVGTDFDNKASHYHDLSDLDVEKKLCEDYVLNFDGNIYDSIDLSDYKGTSIVDALVFKGVHKIVKSQEKNLKDFRMAAADYYGIENYCVNGYISAEKNLELLKIFQLPVDQRPRKQKEVVSKNETTIEEGMYDFETIEIYDPIDEFTHKKIVKLVCIQTGEEKLIEEKVEKCEFENFYNEILKLNQKLCRGCHQFFHSSTEDYQNNSNNANNNSGSDQNSHKNDETKEECVHVFKRIIRYRSARNGNHFKVITLVCKNCNEKITHTYYESCEFNEWNYDASKRIDYRECKNCGYQETRKHEHQIVDGTNNFIWKNGTKAHDKVHLGTCTVCQKEVVQVLEENITCTTEYQYKVIDGKGMDVPVCKDCKHEYRDLAEEHTRHELIGEVQYEYEHDEETNRHRKIRATRKCKHCEKEVEIELTEEEKQWKACSYGEEKTDTEGNKYQECSVCGHKKYVKEECKHGDLENATQKVIWNEDTKTHNIIEEGICKDCGEKVTVVLEKDVDCNSEWHYNVDGRDIFECSDCYHVYENIAHNHNPKVETIHVETKTDDGWCVKTTADCKTCGDNYIVGDQSSQDHNFEFKGTEPYYNPETENFEEREKWVCGDCSTVEYKPVDSVLENSSNIEDEVNTTEAESETEESSSEIESEAEENSLEVESEAEENSSEIESEAEENSSEIEEDSTNSQKSSNESKNKDNQVAYLQELWLALINKRNASLNDEVYIACLDSKGPVRTRTFKK